MNDVVAKVAGGNGAESEFKHDRAAGTTSRDGAVDNDVAMGGQG